MSESDPIEFYGFLKTHQQHIDAFASLVSLLPDDDTLNPLLRVLSNSLEQSMVPVRVYGVKLSEAVTTRLMTTEPCNR